MKLELAFSIWVSDHSFVINITIDLAVQLSQHTSTSGLFENSRTAKKVITLFTAYLVYVNQPSSSFFLSRHAAKLTASWLASNEGCRPPSMDFGSMYDTKEKAKELENIAVSPLSPSARV